MRVEDGGANQEALAQSRAQAEREAAKEAEMAALMLANSTRVALRSSGHGLNGLSVSASPPPARLPALSKSHSRSNSLLSPSQGLGLTPLPSPHSLRSSSPDSDAEYSSASARPAALNATASVHYTAYPSPGRALADPSHHRHSTSSASRAPSVPIGPQVGADGVTIATSLRAVGHGLAPISSAVASASSPGPDGLLSPPPPPSHLPDHVSPSVTHRMNASPAWEEPSEGESVLTVFCGTWNLHAKPFPANLSDFIPPNAYDIYAIGTEECEATIEASILFASKERWVARLVELLGSNYTLVAQHTLQAMHLVVFVRTALYPYVHHIESGSVATGIGDVMGNKGGVGVGFDISHTSMLFINSHFAAHQHKVAQRNADFHKIDSRMPLKLKLLRSSPHLTRVTQRFERVFCQKHSSAARGSKRCAVFRHVGQCLTFLSILSFFLCVFVRDGRCELSRGHDESCSG